jgi:hypothetical protein
MIKDAITSENRSLGSEAVDPTGRGTVGPEPAAYTADASVKHRSFNSPVIMLMSNKISSQRVQGRKVYGQGSK